MLLQPGGFKVWGADVGMPLAGSGRLCPIFWSQTESAGIASAGGHQRLPQVIWRKARASPGSARGRDLPCPSRPCSPKATLTEVAVSFALLGCHRPHVT